MRYPVVIHKDKECDYGVTVPDLPGCFSAGDTFDDALVQVVEAIECHIEGLLIDEEQLPLPSPIEKHQQNPDCADDVWALVTVDLSKLSGKAKRINITLPQRLVTVMDRFASAHGETRSGLIAQATIEYMAAHELVN